MKTISYAVHLVFFSYTILLFIKVIGSWFPNFSQYRFMRFVSHYTDPYLNLFRKIIPPIGGVLDISPILAFFALQIVEQLTLSFLR